MYMDLQVTCENFSHVHPTLVCSNYNILIKFYVATIIILVIIIGLLCFGPTRCSKGSLNTLYMSSKICWALHT